GERAHVVGLYESASAASWVGVDVSPVEAGIKGAEAVAGDAELCIPVGVAVLGVIVEIVHDTVEAGYDAIDGGRRKDVGVANPRQMSGHILRGCARIERFR